MEFQVVKGDITSIKTDAIVLPANTQLREGSGASEMIFKKAGRKELTADCEKLAPIDVGAAVPTSGYRLPATYILHAAVPRWQGGNQNEYALLSSAYLSCLSIADTMGCKSLAFPLLAAGNNGFDPRIAFQIAKETIAFYQKSNSLEYVFLVVYNETVKALILSTGTTVQDCIDPAFMATDDSIMQLLKNKLKDHSLDIAKEVLNIAEDYWNENKRELIDRGMKIAIRVLKNKS